MEFPHMNPTNQYPTLFFGHFFVSDNFRPIRFHVQHPIEWLVLEMDKQKGRALLLSKYILSWDGFADCPIVGTGYKTSWHDSYLRIWLNKMFFEENFSPEEQDMIIPVDNAADRENGKCTIDKVFLLSAEEVKKYFASNESAVALDPTIYFVGKTGDKDDPIIFDFNERTWWTRTSGATEDLVVCVDWKGELCERDSNDDEIGVRPAMWIKF